MISVSLAPEADANQGPRDWIPGDIVTAQVQRCTKYCVYAQVGPIPARMFLDRDSAAKVL